jgi:hypothetical protein
MKFYKINYAYLPASTREVFLSRENLEPGIGVIRLCSVQDGSWIESVSMPIVIAKIVFLNIGVQLSEKTVIDIDCIIEKITQQYRKEFPSSNYEEKIEVKE